MKTIEDYKKASLAYQLFLGKVSDLIGMDKAIELLRQSIEEINKLTKN